MTILEKLEQWVREHPNEAKEPFMNITTQRAFTLERLYEAMKQEAETGVAIVEEELVELKNNLADWLE
jgi:glutamate formiminotransferase